MKQEARGRGRREEGGRGGEAAGLGCGGLSLLEKQSASAVCRAHPRFTIVNIK